jgi:hypothetical protein
MINPEIKNSSISNYSCFVFYKLNGFLMLVNHVKSFHIIPTSESPDITIDEYQSQSNTSRPTMDSAYFYRFTHRFKLCISLYWGHNNKNNYDRAQIPIVLCAFSHQCRFFMYRAISIPVDSNNNPVIIRTAW